MDSSHPALQAALVVLDEGDDRVAEAVVRSSSRLTGFGTVEIDWPRLEHTCTENPSEWFRLALAKSLLEGQPIAMSRLGECDDRTYGLIIDAFALTRPAPLRPPDDDARPAASESSDIPF